MTNSARVQAIFLDWAGTTVDHGSLAPVLALQTLFARHHIELSMDDARRDMGLRSIIPATIGRTPGSADRIRMPWRRRMHNLLASKRSRRRCGYSQRWQVETVNSMMKRNLGSALRGKTSQSRERDLRLKVLTHNLMILR